MTENSNTRCVCDWGRGQGAGTPGPLFLSPLAGGAQRLGLQSAFFTRVWGVGGVAGGSDFSRVALCAAGASS